ncbi:MAG: VCBS repeat-containing protein, partial [Acidobacteria bacterium]|nr:VCBS repeat-containing protein [Acidobacteriota bacterium]
MPFRKLVIAVVAFEALGFAAKFYAQTASPTASPPGPLPTFEDVSKEAGIDFRHSFGETKLSSIMEATGSGCAWVDYDNDGFLDLYVLSGRYMEGVTKFSKPAGRNATNKLYRNNGDGTFLDVTAKAGVPGKDFGMAVTAGDYDNDGHVDLYITNYESAVLYRNNGDGTFTDA